jgi:hypothetical protein
MYAHFPVELEYRVVGEIFRVRDESIEDQSHAVAGEV